MGLMKYFDSNPHKLIIKILFIPAMIVTFFISLFIPSIIFGMGIGVTTLKFASEASYAPVYFIIAGIAAFFISAPNGETNFIAMLISLGGYLATIFLPKYRYLSGLTIDILMSFLWIALSLLFFGGILYLLIGFMDDKISKLEWIKNNNLEQKKARSFLAI